MAVIPDQQYQSRIEIVSGGSVEFQDGSLNISTGGQIAVSAADRVFAYTGAMLSAAGSIDTALARFGKYAADQACRATTCATRRPIATPAH